MFTRNTNTRVRSSNPFALLANENGLRANKVPVSFPNKKLLNKIKQLQKEEDEGLANWTPPVEVEYPMVQLTTWTGTKPRAPSPIFEMEEDEQQIGPEMRKIYDYLEEVYQENLHRNIYETDKEKENINSEDEFDNDF